MSQRHFSAPPAIPMTRQPLIFAICPTIEPVAAAGAGYDDGFALFRTADVQEAEIGGDPDHSEHAHRELDRRARRQLSQRGGLQRRIVLPTEETEHDFAGF